VGRTSFAPGPGGFWIELLNFELGIIVGLVINSRLYSVEWEEFPELGICRSSMYLAEGS
jgi:hypothetical protein